jgi:acetyl esterase
MIGFAMETLARGRVSNKNHSGDQREVSNLARFFSLCFHRGSILTNLVTTNRNPLGEMARGYRLGGMEVGLVASSTTKVVDLLVLNAKDEVWNMSGMNSKTLSRSWMLVFAAIFLQPSYCLGQARTADGTRRRMAPTHADVRYGTHERNVIDLYLAKSETPTPLVLYVHGGGFRGGDKSTVNQADLRSFLDLGFSLAAMNYRLTDSAPAPAQYLDCARALQFLRHNAAQWNLDGKRVASTGSSAGAGTSMWLAFHDDLADPSNPDPIARESTRLTCVAVTNGQSSYDPVFAQSIGIPRPNFDRHPFFLPFYGIEEQEIDTPAAYAKYREMAPITFLTAGDAPVWMDYNRQNIPVTAESDVQLVVHHPLLGIELKRQMDALRIECIIQYLGPSGRKVRHGDDRPVTSAVQFVQKYLALPAARHP